MMNGHDENGYAATIPPPEPMFEGSHNTSQSGISVDDENPGFDQGHSLPNVDELKTDHNAKSSEFVTEDGEIKRRGAWVVMAALFLAILVIAVIIGVAVTVSKQQNQAPASTTISSSNFDTPAPIAPQSDYDGKETVNDVTPAPTPQATVPPPQPTASAEDRTALIKEYLVNQGISTDSDLSTANSPQQKALNWIAVNDPSQVKVPAGDKTTPEGYDFMTRYVLAVLFYTTNGDRWTYSLNFLQSFNVCYWYSILQYPDGSQDFRGVACSENGQIAALFMTRNEMEGPLPKELAELTTLVAVDFNFNLLRGKFPESYQNFVNMQNLFVMSNRLTGSIPTWIDKLTSMRNINLSHNLMTGRLPNNIGNLMNMKGIALDNNLFEYRLDGVFDTSVIPGLRTLEQLYLENNQFTGTIGEHFVALANMTHLDISDNGFSGVIPTHVFQMTNLKVLDLHDNEFTTLPSSFPVNENLELLALQKNAFAGQRLPDGLDNLKKLTHLDVSQNAFTGTMPSEIGAISDLSYLFLAANEFNPGPIPDFFSQLSNLEELSLKSTQRTGPIPNFLGTLSHLVLLDLDENNLTGEIPSNLGDLSDLHILLLNRNNLTSTIPTTFKNLRSLKLLFVEANDNITGDLNDLYCTNPSFLMKPVLVAECSLCSAAAPECCTTCCEHNVECNPGIHVPDLDPIWQLSYQRVYFTFGREDFFDKDVRANAEDDP